MKNLRTLFYVSLFILTGITTSRLSAESWGQKNRNTPPIAEENQKAPEIPNQLMPKREPMQTEKAHEDKTKMTLAEVISADPSFKTFTGILNQTQLINRLHGPAVYTIFAPNDYAFAKLSPNALADLLKPENQAKLIGILNYHIVPGKITREKLKTMKIKSLQDKELEIQVKGDQATVNNGKITLPGQAVSNGIIYTIDTVLIP